LAEAKVKVRYPREAVSTGMRILGEGQLSLTKVLMLTDSNTPERPFNNYLESYLSRMDPKVDLHVFSCTSQDTLDYTGPKVNEGSKLMMVAVGEPKFDLCDREPEALPDGVSASKLFCKGCLVIQTNTSHSDSPKIGKHLASHPNFSAYRMIVMVDDVEAATKNEMAFLWTLFTRFEPAADIYASHSSLERFHVRMDAPILIDARLKSWYPGLLVMPDEIIRQVDDIYPELF
jgi:3-polyprenyl-4-hydroxybenzoate decarboxylase